MTGRSCSAAHPRLVWLFSRSREAFLIGKFPNSTPLRSHREVISVMQNWMLPHIYDYWDERVQATDRLSRALGAVPPSQRDGQLGLIRAAIARHVEALSDVTLREPHLSSRMIYTRRRTISPLGTTPSKLYLWASANPFFEAVRTRGYILSYVVDNSFEDLTRPVRFYPLWYKPTGLCYICPQHIAYSLQILEKCPMGPKTTCSSHSTPLV